MGASAVLPSNSLAGRNSNLTDRSFARDWSSSLILHFRRRAFPKESVSQAGWSVQMSRGVGAIESLEGLWRNWGAGGAFT